MSKILKNWDKYLKKVEAAAVKSMIQFEASLKDEIIQGTPKDTGGLRDSYSFGELSKPNPYNIDYSFSFGAGLVGDDGLPYASLVHEWEDKAVNWTTPGTGAGFLIRPVSANQADLKSIYRLNLKGIRL